MSRPTAPLLAWVLVVLALTSLPAAVVASDAATGTTSGSDATDDGGGIPLAPIVLFGGAAVLVAAYVRYAGRPPGTGPTPPPEPHNGTGPAGDQPGPEQAGSRAPAESGRRTDAEPHPGASDDDSGPETGED